MKNIHAEILLIIFLIPAPVFAREYLYILNDNCINELYNSAKQIFIDSKINILRDPHGIILRFELPKPEEEYNGLSVETTQKIYTVISFLAKIKNPVIIEVHTENIPKEKLNNYKNWEISTVIANRIEDYLLKRLNCDRIHSVGYGEFFPAKNTSNNGVNYPNRVDIMILCNVSGE